MKTATQDGEPIGRRIVARRKELGQSREDLARHFMRGLSTIRNWEVGLTEPTGEDLVAVEKYLQKRSVPK